MAPDLIVDLPAVQMTFRMSLYGHRVCCLYKDLILDF